MRGRIKQGGGPDSACRGLVFTSCVVDHTCSFIAAQSASDPFSLKSVFKCKIMAMIQKRKSVGYLVMNRNLTNLSSIL